jgi:hypothetical protein
VALSATQISADDDIRNINPFDRNCLFKDENFDLKLHKDYSQANCFLECSLFYAQKTLKERNNLTKECTPWYFPFVGENPLLCDPWETIELSDLLQNNIPEDECKHCLPDCTRVIYQHTSTAEPFR